jgi:hypothetical protein
MNIIFSSCLLKIFLPQKAGETGPGLTGPGFRLSCVRIHLSVLKNFQRLKYSPVHL